MVRIQVWFRLECVLGLGIGVGLLSEIKFALC